MLLSALGYAGAALVYRRWLADVPAIGVTALMTAISSVAFLAPASREPAREDTPASSILALVTLGIINAGPAYWLFYLLIDQAGAATASVITYVMPVVALVLGVALLEEQLTIGAIAGLPLIGLGAWLATSRQPTAARDPCGRAGRQVNLETSPGRDRLGGETAGRLSRKNRGVDPHGTPQPGPAASLARFPPHIGPRVPHGRPDDTDWRAHGACISADPELFFPISSSGASRRQETRAKAILRWLPRERGMPGLRSGDPAGAWRVGWPW